MAELPPEVQSFLDDWFCPEAGGDWASLLPLLSGDWAEFAVPATASREQGEQQLPGQRDAGQTLHQSETDALALPPMVRSPSDVEDARTSAPSASGDDSSDAKSEGQPLEAGVQSAMTVARKPSRNVSRDRMKSELQYLRQRALELETQLAGLKSNSTTKQSDNQDNSVLRTVWQTIAERQLARRRQVESVNDRLKGMLVEYTALARRLEQFLYKRPRPEDLLCDDADTSILLKKSRMISSIDVDDEALLLRFVGDLEAEFELVDTILGPANVGDVTTLTSDTPYEPVMQTKTSIHGRQVKYMELNGMSVIPFPFERSHKAAWIAFNQRYQRDEYVTYDVDRPDDTIAVRFPMEYQGRILDNILAIRRYMLENRMIWVWRALSECPEECKHILTDETGWCVFESSPPQGESPTTATVMRSCVHVVPIQRVTHEPLDLGADEISVLGTVLAEAYANDETAISATVADLLLEDPHRF